MSEIAIHAEGLSKRYRIGACESYQTLRDSLTKAVKAAFRKPKGSSSEDTIWAVKDASFEIRQGDVVGIIGRNGAGKSTLLKVLSRITTPTEGRAVIHGRVGSLLEIGTGFHPELTGRENIFLNGAILGMSKVEIRSRFDEIVAFSEVEKFLDTPVKHYSSGMHVRLAFAIAAHLEPEILIVDEVLAVGDMTFQKKCLGKMNDVSRGGRTVVFVSHSMAAVENLCRRGIVMDRGHLVFDGSMRDAAQYYFGSVSTIRDSGDHIFDLINAGHRVFKVRKLLKRVELYTTGDQPANEGVRMGERLKIRVHFELPCLTDNFNIGIGFNNIFGQRIFTAYSIYEPDRSHGERSGPQVFVCDISSFTLTPGTYTVWIWLDVRNTEVDSIEDALQFDVIESDFYGTGRLPTSGMFVLEHRWTLDHHGVELENSEIAEAV
ncbi:MAG: ABC transporter ATP-binding protein [Acidobacteriaceae bacterium]|nr:ABC transporter ATP-binding protein [Acidobacteriaceae bacterium]